MALHITDPVLDALAEQAQRILNAPTKEDAVRQALARVVEKAPETSESLSDDKSRSEKLKALQDRLKRIGRPNPDFDDKAFLDEMWGM